MIGDCEECGSKSGEQCFAPKGVLCGMVALRGPPRLWGDGQCEGCGVGKWMLHLPDCPVVLKNRVDAGYVPGEKGINPKDLIGATKAPLSLLPWAGLTQVAAVFALGAKKYGPHNWREKGKAVQHMTYVEAAMRHLAAYIDGETIDPESGVSHLAHVAAGMLILTDAVACGNAVDNRPTPAPTAELMALQAKKV